MISGNKKLRFIRCNESELTGENSKYPVTEGYVYICEDTENVYFDDSDNKRHLVNGKSLDGSTTFIINELIKQNIEYKNLLNSINASQSSASPQNKEREIQFNSVSDLLNNSTILDYSSNNFSEIPCITIKSVNVREDWAKPYYRYATIEDASKTSAKLVFKFDESIANENNRGPINIDVEYTLNTSKTTTNIYSAGDGININDSNKEIGLSSEGIERKVDIITMEGQYMSYGPKSIPIYEGAPNLKEVDYISIPYITVDRYGRIVSVENKIYYPDGTIVIDNKNKSMNLSETGVVPGTYGPSDDVIGYDGCTIVVPCITVDKYGRITDICNRTYTSVNNCPNPNPDPEPEPEPEPEPDPDPGNTPEAPEAVDDGEESGSSESGSDGEFGVI